MGVYTLVYAALNNATNPLISICKGPLQGCRGTIQMFAEVKVQKFKLLLTSASNDQ